MLSCLASVPERRPLPIPRGRGQWTFPLAPAAALWRAACWAAPRMGAGTLRRRGGACCWVDRCPVHQKFRTRDCSSLQVKIPTWPADDGSQVDRTTSVIANRLAQSPRESRRGAWQETGLLRHHRLLSAGVPPPLRHGTRCGPPRSCWASTKGPEKEECKEVEAVAPPFGPHTHGVRVASMGHGRARWRWRSSNSGPPCSEQ